MTIDWEKGEINDEPYILQSNQIYTTFGELQPPTVAYIGTDQNSMMPDDYNRLWIAPRAVVYNESEAAFINQEEYLCRLILVHEGAIIDASAGDFILDGKPSSMKFERPRIATTGPELDALAAAGIKPVIEVITSDERREALASILFRRYGIDLILDASALSGPEPDDQPEEPGFPS